MSSVDIVIVDFKSENLVNECLKSINAGVLEKHEIGKICVVDNSGDGFQRQYNSESIPISVIKPEKNIGFGAACNVGARQGESEFILFLNPDTRVFDNSIELALSSLSSLPQASGLGIQFVDSSSQLPLSYFCFPTVKDFWKKLFGVGTNLSRSTEEKNDYTNKEPYKIDFPMGAFLLVRRCQFLEVGCFDELFFLYYDEVDLCLRLNKRFGSIFFDERIKVYHLGRGTTDSVKAQRLFYSLRSRLFYSFKYFSSLSIFQTIVISFVCEPLFRFFYLLLKLKFSSIFELIHGYTLLIFDLKRIWFTFSFYRHLRLNFTVNLSPDKVLQNLTN